MKPFSLLRLTSDANLGKHLSKFSSVSDWIRRAVEKTQQMAFAPGRITTNFDLPISSNQNHLISVTFQNQEKNLSFKDNWLLLIGKRTHYVCKVNCQPETEMPRWKLVRFEVSMLFLPIHSLT